MIPFTRLPDGRVEARLTDGEAEMLRSLAEQVAALIAQHEDAAGDPALARLLPDGYRGDAEAAAEFRRYTESDLADRKIAGAKAMLATLDEQPVVLGIEQWNAWLRVMTDVRLALAARLGIQHDEDDGDLSTEEGRAMREVYDWVGYLQEALLHAVG